MNEKSTLFRSPILAAEELNSLPHIYTDYWRPLDKVSREQRPLGHSLAPIAVTLGKRIVAQPRVRSETLKISAPSASPSILFNQFDRGLLVFPFVSQLSASPLLHIQSSGEHFWPSSSSGSPRAKRAPRQRPLLQKIETFHILQSFPALPLSRKSTENANSGRASPDAHHARQILDAVLYPTNA